jgi:hypothetical protein
VCDDVVVTRNLDFSHIAAEDADNVWAIHSEAQPELYSSNIDQLVKAYC